MQYPMSISDALAYERMLLSGYLRDSRRRSLTPVEKRLYAQKVKWIQNLKELDAEGYRVVAADGTALGPARKRDVEEHVNTKSDMALAMDQCNPYDFN